jgi:hypothetical protein
MSIVVVFPAKIIIDTHAYLLFKNSRSDFLQKLCCFFLNTAFTSSSSPYPIFSEQQKLICLFHFACNCQNRVSSKIITYKLLDYRMNIFCPWKRRMRVLGLVKTEEFTIDRKSSYLLYRIIISSGFLPGWRSHGNTLLFSNFTSPHLNGLKSNFNA